MNKLGHCFTKQAILAAAICLVPLGASANPAAFYENKQLMLIVGHQAGTGFDIYARALVPHFRRNLPTSASVVIQHMPGAGGMTAANWLYNVAIRDGTVIGTFSQQAMLGPLTGNVQARFEPSRFSWIGNMDASVGICGVSAASGVGSLSELLKRQDIIFAGTGATATPSKLALAVNRVLGAKFNVVVGYKGTADIKLAMERGEAHGICGLPWSTVKSFWSNELETREFRPILVLNGDRPSELSKLPHMLEFMKDERPLYDFLFGIQSLGRIYAAPPDVPDDRVQFLRQAFIETMQDAKFLSDTRKLGIDITASAGDQVALQWDRIVKTPREIVDRANALTSVNAK